MAGLEPAGLLVHKSWTKLCGAQIRIGGYEQDRGVYEVRRRAEGRRQEGTRRGRRGSLGYNLSLPSVHGMQVRRVKWAVVHPAVADASTPLGYALVSTATHAGLLQAWNVWRCSYNTHLRFQPIFQANDSALLLLDRPSTMRPLLHLPPGEAGSRAVHHWLGCTRAH